MMLISREQLCCYSSSLREGQSENIAREHLGGWMAAGEKLSGGMLASAFLLLPETKGDQLPLHDHNVTPISQNVSVCLKCFQNY